MSTTIEWTAGPDGSPGRTWNPVRGCSRISPGCLNCYAERIAARFSDGEHVDADGVVTDAQPFHLFAERKPMPHWTGKMALIEEKLLEPLSWRKPCRVFVNSMSDLFHENLSFEDIDLVFTSMMAAPEHTYQILTKRAKRMHNYFASGRHDDGCGPDRATYHLDQQIWLGVSVEDRTRKERIDWLRDTPAEVRFLSVEPLLEDIGKLDLEGIAWVIVGGESGHAPRPFNVDWARSIVDQCKAADVACFVKQLGGHVIQGGERRIKKSKKGSDMHEWPHEIRVREFPKVAR